MVGHLDGLLVLLAYVGSGFGALPAPSEDLMYTRCKYTNDSVYNYKHDDLKTSTSESMDQYDGKVLLVVNTATY